MFGNLDTSFGMWVLRAWLLGGLLFHKAVWEFLKRGSRTRPPAAPRLALVKAAKIMVLAGIVVQTLLPFDILPLLSGPAALLRWLGAALFSAGLLTAVSARLELGRNWSDIEVAQLTKDHGLVATGVYRYIRHPIYAGDLLLLAGLELALNSWLVAGVAVLALVVARKVVSEEAGLARGLPEYAVYCERTKRFVPFVY
jgi:protein-S-isoprenylcysteine O-methyltransferase Ste14